MEILTGQTVYENVASFNNLNNPISAATFDAQMYKDGVLFTGITIGTPTLTDAQRAIFTFSWSASSYGDYQMFAKNNDTTVIYMSEVYKVVAEEDKDFNVYVGI